MGTTRDVSSATAVLQPETDDLFVTKGAQVASPSPSPELVLRVNEKFAKAFEERKRKEELSALAKRRLDEDDDDDDESESETEDEDGEELTTELDRDITKTLQLIRQKDPAIYDSSIAFFKQSETSEEDESRNTEKNKKQAPLYYKDLVRQKVIAGEVDESEDEEVEARVQTYAEEQAEMKKMFMDSLKEKEKETDHDNEEDLDGGLFTVRKKSDGETKQDEEDYQQFTSKYGTQLKKEEMDRDKFLEHYLTTEGWKDKTAVVPHYEDIVKDDEEDAEALEKAENFEHSYNFRFEEQGSSVIETHARFVPDTMRREDDSRKRKRAVRKERKALERQKKEEELRRLKNLKQAEIELKLRKVARLMGEVEGAAGLRAEDLEGDFDPDEYDKRMQAVFDEQYYDEDDNDMEKPTWDEDEDKELFADLPVDPEEEEEKETESHTNDACTLAEETDHVDEEEQTQEKQDEAETLSKKLTLKEMQREKQKYLDELYSLDYEDLIGDIKCRFKYRQVDRNDFGLTVDEIMAADDKELKQLVSLKRMAPYVDREYSVDNKRLKNFRKSVQEAHAEKRRRKRAKETADSEAQTEQPKKKKRKRSKKMKTEEQPNAEEVELTKESKPGDKKEKKRSSTEDASKKSSNDVEKHHKRRSKKKKKTDSGMNVYALTGLPASRLESYKLVNGCKN
ncbi:hypothetical protein PsorP6_007771 [Peronosclerospora sorghi]|uniref:Uncharacterized protein n=1 Tax=Peronosclerospora sorghi TaxID=230839 RepID=A0ACC0WC22_9STRA|nr:hypothetical protein PsorP6_007771 [Peronosclerospora sorghi]